MSVNNETCQAVRAALQDKAALVALARAAQSATAGMGEGRYSDDELAQLVHGFTVLIDEALDGRADAFDLFIETAVPGLLADGQTPSALVAGSATFVTLVTAHVLDRVPAPVRGEVAVWLAVYFGRYCGAVAAVSSTTPASSA